MHFPVKTVLAALLASTLSLPALATGLNDPVFAPGNSAKNIGSLGSGHVFGNGSSASTFGTDTPLITIMQQSGSGLGSGVAGAAANGVNTSGGFTTYPIGSGSLASGAASQNLNLAPFTLSVSHTMTSAPRYNYSAMQFYVATAGNGGSDSNDCLASTVTGGHGPCLTPQHAVDIALQYDLGSHGTTINIGAGTFQAPMVSGPLRGTGGNGISGQYLVILGAGHAQTTLNDTTGRLFLFETSDHANAGIGQLTLSIDGAKSGIFAQNGSVVQIYPDLWLTGTSASDFAFHVEGYGLIELGLGVNPTVSGTFNAVMSAGITGYIEFDPAGPSTLTCSGTVSFNSFIFMQNGSAQFGNGWTFPGCNTATGQHYSVQSASMLYNFTGVSLPGDQSGREVGGGRAYPAVTPTVSTSSGFGTGSAFVVSGASTLSGTVKLTAGTSPGNSGTLQLTWADYAATFNGSPAQCVAMLRDGFGTGAAVWQPGATIKTSSLSSTTTSYAVTFAWANSATALTASGVYFLDYICQN